MLPPVKVAFILVRPMACHGLVVGCDIVVAVHAVRLLIGREKQYFVHLAFLG